MSLLARFVSKAKRAAALKRAEAAGKRSDPQGLALAKRVKRARLTFLELEPLMDLRLKAQQLDSHGVPGVFMELGTALGGSAIMLAGSKDHRRPLEVYDVFGMIPPPSDRDGTDVQARYDEIASGRARGFGGDVYYGYQSNLKDKVIAAFGDLGYPPADHSVTFHEGLFEDTLHPSGPIALAHIDGDWYDSVKVCLERVWPALSPGGVMIIDDYDAWTGCRTAVDEFLRNNPDCLTERHSRLHIVRKPR